MLGFCEHGNEPSDSLKVRELFDYLGTISFSRRALLYGVRVILFPYFLIEVKMGKLC